ncbi:14875_t:CDS:2, partial [Acaulospora morrowiae]
SKSLDPSQNTVHSTAKVPLIPPTPVSKNSNSQTVKNSLLSWETVSKRKSVASTSTAISSSASVLDKTHDFRFGGIEVEWFDNCEENMNGDQKEQNIGSYANAVKGGQNETLNSDNTLSTQSSNVLPPHDPSSSQTSTRTNKQKTKSSNDKLTNSPAGKFVPLKSGTTNLSCGILHLYRDPKEILPPNDNQESGLALSVEAEEKQDESLSVLGNDDTILAVLAVPSYLSASDFLGFVAPVQRFVSHFRFIRDSAPNKFIVLMKFRHSRAAKDFYKQYNGRPFSSMEPEICHLVYIKSIEFKSTSIPPYIFPFLHDPFSPSAQEVSKLPAGNDQIQKSPILYELPTCPVCLERMDASVTGLLTILCQHTFHCNCLSKWGDICRYSQKHYDYDPSMEQNECGVCGATENLWICLVCGNIGCGRYQEAHAYCHYKETSHLYALELETQRVWDYAGDGYVHRLIQNKSDGKLVELPSPDAHPQMQQSNTDQVVQQEKLDAIGLEYSYLL